MSTSELSEQSEPPATPTGVSRARHMFARLFGRKRSSSSASSDTAASTLGSRSVDAGIPDVSDREGSVTATAFKRQRILQHIQRPSPGTSASHRSSGSASPYLTQIYEDETDDLAATSDMSDLVLPSRSTRRTLSAATQPITSVRRLSTTSENQTHTPVSSNAGFDRPQETVLSHEALYLGPTRGEFDIDVEENDDEGDDADIDSSNILIQDQATFNLATATEVWDVDKIFSELGPSNRNAGRNMINALHTKIGIDWATDSQEAFIRDPDNDEASNDLDEDLTFRRSFHLDFFAILGRPLRSFCLHEESSYLSLERTTFSFRQWTRPIAKKQCSMLPFPTVGSSLQFGYTASSNIQWYMLACPKDTSMQRQYKHNGSTTAMTYAHATVFQGLFLEALIGTAGLEATATQDGDNLSNFRLGGNGACELTYRQLGILLEAFFEMWTSTVSSLRDSFFATIEPCVFCYAIGGNVQLDPVSPGITSEFGTKFNLLTAASFSYALAVNIACTDQGSPGESFAGSASYSLLGNKEAILREYPDPTQRQEVYFYPMAWSPSAISYQSRHSPAFFRREFLREINEDLQDLCTRNGQGSIVTSSSTQMYSVVSHNVRKRPGDFKMGSGSHSGGMCLSLEDKDLGQAAKRKRDVLLLKIENGKFFRQIKDSVRQAMQQRHYGYRIEMVISVNLSGLQPQHRTFSFLEDSIIHRQIDYWLHADRERTLMQILYKFPSEVWPAILIPINHGLEAMMESMLLHFKQLSELNLASREIVSLIERLSVSSFTGDHKIPYTIWKQLGILSGLQQRGFPHVNQSVLDLWSRALRGQYWLSNTGDNRPVTFSHLRAIRYHYGDLIWAQCTMQSRLELFLSIQGVHASGVSIGECIRVVSAIIVDQFVPEVCRSIASYWDRIYLENVKRAHVFEQQINAHFEEWGVPLLASGENSSGRSDQDCLEAYFVENVDNSELDDSWIQKQCDNVAAHRDQFTRTLLDLRSQKAVVDAIASGGKFLRRGHTSSSAAAAAGLKSSETPIALGHEIKTELDEAFPLNKNSSRDKLSLKSYSESMSVLAFTGRANAQSTDGEDIHESSCIRNLFLKGMTWQSSLQQLVRFCQRSATDEKGGITPVFLAATIEEALITNGIYFVMGYYQNRLTASRSMILTRQENLGPPGVQGHEANLSSMQAPKKNQSMLGHVESRFGIKLSESTLPEDLQLGKKGLLDDLAKNPRQESQEMFWRVSRIFQGLDLGDYRHFHLVLVAQILFLHTPPPEVLVKSNLQYSFTKNRPNSRNTKWLAAFVVFGLMKMHEDELMKTTCAREGDPKNLMTKIGKYNITARLMLRAGLFDDCGLSGDLKNFNQWRFVSLSRSEQEVARIRHAATEGPLIFLMTVWPRDVAEDLAS